MKVLFVSSREMSYTRNDVILRAFHRFSEVEWLGSNHRPTSLVLKSIQLIFSAIPKVLAGHYDLIFIGFYGHLVMLFPFNLIFRQPILFDAFVSTYDTLIEDRKISTKGSLFAQVANWLDRKACKNADRVLLDTPLHIEYFNRQFGIPREKMVSIPVGCNEDIFLSRGLTDDHRGTRVLYYTSYLPLHGVDVVVRAASMLQDEAIYLRLIGAGQTFRYVKDLAYQLHITNIEFASEVPIEHLADEIDVSDICLGGHFGNTEKAGRVVPGKVYQILAMAKPLIATATPANLMLLSHMENAYLCNPGDPVGLAEAIRLLSKDSGLRKRLSQAGYQLYMDKCSEKVITRMIHKVVDELISSN